MILLKKYKHNTKIAISILVLCLFNINSFSQSIYTNNMDYVLGDCKQRFIQGQVTTQEQADNLLKGFITMKVNGIRIPIFPRDANTGETINPHPVIMKYFYEQALAAGFKIFANPAQGGGGTRIANNSLNYISSVKDIQAATDELVNRIIEFSNEYPDCKWMNPFNEDGRATNSTWSVNQINEVYRRLFEHGLNGAELIGPCTWGLPAGIDMLKNTNIADYITVASSHNLGHNDGQWGEFMNLAAAENLPVWDSEANNDPGNGTVNKVEAAITNKVDGLVVYNSGHNINLSTGIISATNEYYMSQYLKPVINFALEGIATQSSTFPSFSKQASLAIDGNTNGFFGSGSVTLTNNEEKPWWQVDLGEDKAIGDIKVFNRTDGCCKGAMSNFTVSVTNAGGIEVFNQTYTTIPDPSIIINTNGIQGRIVKVQLNTTSVLTLAEVQVFNFKGSLSTKTLSTKIQDKIEVSIFPNPVVNTLKINAHDAIFKQYTIYNINGQVIERKNISSKNLEINTSNYLKGIYILKLDSDQFSGSYKIVKN